ncbi:MAG: hypothetical protein OER04_13445 [Cyclobacteriaceae bacterium]|nr:hypothetical protein [Cyclobacteriaceae bacterium]
MNDRGLDGLFKERLEGYQKKPSEAAWGKLEGNLKSHKKVAWWKFVRVAAVVALIASSIYIFNIWINNHPEQPALTNTQDIPSKTDTERSVHTETPAQDQELISESPVIDEQSGNEELSRSEATGEATPAKTEQREALEENNHENAPNLGIIQTPQTRVLANETLLEDSELNQEDQHVETVETLATNQDEEPSNTNEIEEEQKSRTITITYKKSPAPPEPTLALVKDPQEKTSRAKKVLQRAQEIKKGELGGLARIRAAKDQLLVFNKKSKEKELKSN